MDTPISIIIPAFNQVVFCRQCIQSVLMNTRRAYKLILVDNGSTDGVTELFDNVPDAVAVHSPTNLGFAGGVNLGLERAEGHVLLLNSDTLVPQGWLQRLENALLEADDVGMVGPMSNNVSGVQQIDGLAFTSLDEVDAFARELAERNAGKRREVPRLVGFCLLIRDSVLAEAGRFDEAYGIGNYEDDDYCMHVRAAGYRLCLAEDAFVFHYGGRTFLGMGMTGEKWNVLMERNRRRFEEKWRLTAAQRHDAAQESQRLNEQAREALKQGKTKEALRLLKRAIETCATLETNYNDLGVVLWHLNERERALDQFVRAVRLNPGYGEARDNLRDAAQALGRMTELEALLNNLQTRKTGQPRTSH